MKSSYLLIIPILVLVGCKHTTPDRIMHSPGYQFGESMNRPFNDMIANARQSEIEIGSVHFAFDRSELTQSAKEQLDRIARMVNEHEGLVVVEGHTDHINTDEFNQRLGYRRALAVADYLRSAGVWDERLVIRSFGEERPEATNWNDSGRELNRRVAIRMFAQGEIMGGKEALQAHRKRLGQNTGTKSQPQPMLLGQIVESMPGIGAGGER